MWFNKLDKQLDKETDDLHRLISRLKADNDNLQRQLQEIRSRENQEYSKASYSVDWTAMNAFSVERIREGGGFKTLIGYMMSEPAVTTENDITYKDVVREWTLYCSHEEHQRLVAEFNEWKADKYGY